jgi:membrane protease YdiL (CAAX protease family)
LIAKVTGYGHGAASQAFAKLPVWLVFIVVVRAGVVEELFYRGYAIERLQGLGFGRIARERYRWLYLALHTGRGVRRIS